METLSLQEALDDLASAEDFLDYFGIAWEPSVVQVSRLHILQRFHDYIAQAPACVGDEAARTETYRALLRRAYEDFVTSDARTEKVFRVFRRHEPRLARVSLAALRR